MIQDEEYDEQALSPERIKALGFKPQKELLVNHLLPYASALDEESTKFLEQVKVNLAKSVMLREMKPSCGVWSSRLMKYLRLYGLKMSKEDHIALIKLAFELVLIPDLEPCKVHKFATMFLMLTKKRYLISPEELTLPWRPLYEMGKKIFDKSETAIGMYHYLGSLEGTYLSMISCAKPYFHLNATKEVLEEFLPQLSPWSSDSHPVSQLSLFLPVGLPPSKADYGHKLWFDKLIELWETCFSPQFGISELIALFADLSKRNPGAVDWTPHVPKMFMFILHSLNLPVSYKDMQCSRNYNLDIKQAAIWIVWNIRPDGVVLKHLKSFLGGIESYLHSANSGRWSFKLRDLLRKLAREFLNRVRKERIKKYLESWENKTPPELKLREEDITEFVKIMLEPTLQAVYSRSGSLDVSIALQNLASMRPAIVIPPLLDRLRTSLTSLTEPHRVTAAMSAVAAVARPMLRGGDVDYPEGPTHAVPFLLAVLPGLDPNDIKKTLVTLHFILIFSSMIPYIDCSSAHEYWSDLTEEELLVCESTAQLEDFVLVFLDRLFIIIESSAMEHVRLDTKDSEGMRSKTDAVTETAISSAATSVLMQCSPKIFKEALRKFKSFATDSTFETNVSGSMVGVLLRVFARIDAESTLAAFLPPLCAELNEILATDEALHEENPPRDLVYRLVLLMNLVQCDGTVLLKYMSDLIPVLDRILKIHAKYALTRACEVLGGIFYSLSHFDLKETRSSPKDYSEAPQKWLPVREWGRGCLMSEAKLQWHVPSAEEAACAQMLVDRYLMHEVRRLRQWLADERPMCRDRKLRSFYIIYSTLSASSFLPPNDEEPVILTDSQVPPTSLPFTNGVPHSITVEGQNMRAAMAALLLDVQAKMLAADTDETRGLEMLTQLWERVVVVKPGRYALGLEARLRSHSAMERALDGRGLAGPVWSRARLRSLLADTARIQDEARFDLICEAGITPSALKALHALYDLSINTYTSVRVLSQIRLYWMLSHYPYSYRALLPRLVQLLAEGGEGDEWHARHKGALFIMLGPRAGPLIAKQDWHVVRELSLAVLKAPLSEKPSIMKLEQAFGETLHRNFPTVNTRLKISQGACEAAKYFLNENQMSETEFKKMLEVAETREDQVSDDTEKLYRDFMDELIDIASSPNLPWRRLELIMQILTSCSSLQTAYPPRAVHFMVQALVHDDITVRRSAQRLVAFCLRQRKKKVVKMTVDPYQVAGVPKPKVHVPGYRKDLEWVMWDKDYVPQTDEEWDRPWLKKSHYGFYCWPERLEVAAPSHQQFFFTEQKVEDMEDGERHIFEFFYDEANVDRLVAFLTVEEKKGKDKFNGVRFVLFKLLFSHFGERIASKFFEHALRCASDPQEAPQRLAAEVAAAAMSAPRYWPLQRARLMHNTALDIIKAGLTAVTAETIEDWGTCLATGVDKLDPRRSGHVLSALLDFCAPQSTDGTADDQQASFVLCARLIALQGALGTLTWRAAPLAAELLKRLESTNFIQHPYQNVRETVGSALMTIFDTELVFPGGDSGPAPRLEHFLRSVRPRLAALYDEHGDIVVKSVATITMPCSVQGGSMETLPARAAVRAGRAHALLPATHAPHDVAAQASTSASGEGEGEAEVEDEAEGEAEGEGSEVLELQLEEQLNTSLRLAGDAAPPPAAATTATPADHANAVNLLTTVLRGCMGLVVRGSSNHVDAQYCIVGIACAAATRGPLQPHEELGRAAGGLLAGLACAPHAPDTCCEALRTLRSLAVARSWWARLACVELAQPLLFYALPVLCANEDYAKEAEQFALTLMKDRRLEVRQTAAKLLTGLMHCKALPDEERTLQLLARSCRSKELVEKHRGVLGLCAYLASRPYSLGPRLGLVLAELARHTGAPDPIPATIRTSLADFRRTHQDDWQKHRDQLTEEELDLLSDLTSPPSYFA
ncbi:PREDICTED: proteasome activator complex subunit 4-like isoform X2 [Papilio xuthus]|uniref:Proteasome activator complex subunit 4-like isoform X2 n=1 Tax=Papilio xuthus TaxID=66420 RepID=A0AAJ6ZEE9_PAPXU|nr:PREDICTED: proteasome activator complex subunit 4-like isoform X2 [Papilio xuthus]